MTNLEQIKVGDRVWVGNGREPRNRLRLVSKLTPAQIVVEGEDRFRRDTGRAIGATGLYSRFITGIATPAECAEWDAEQVREVEEATARRLQREAHEAKRDELTTLFDSERAFVQDAGHNLLGEWMLNVYGTEDDMRRLAEALRDHLRPV